MHRVDQLADQHRLGARQPRLEVVGDHALQARANLLDLLDGHADGEQLVRRVAQLAEEPLRVGAVAGHAQALTLPPVSTLELRSPVCASSWRSGWTSFRATSWGVPSRIPPALTYTLTVIPPAPAAPPMWPLPCPPRGTTASGPASPRLYDRPERMPTPMTGSSRTPPAAIRRDGPGTLVPGAGLPT